MGSQPLGGRLQVGFHQLPHLPQAAPLGAGHKEEGIRGEVSAGLVQPLPPDTHAGLQGAPSLLPAAQSTNLPSWMLLFC